jgi:hypothetical protein
MIYCCHSLEIVSDEAIFAKLMTRYEVTSTIGYLDAVQSQP